MGVKTEKLTSFPTHNYMTLQKIHTTGKSPSSSSSFSGLVVEMAVQPTSSSTIRILKETIKESKRRLIWDRRLKFTHQSENKV
jgi:hypothetical protein